MHPWPLCFLKQQLVLCRLDRQFQMFFISLSPGLGWGGGPTKPFRDGRFRGARGGRGVRAVGGWRRGSLGWRWQESVGDGGETGEDKGVAPER